jgi:hypothetical protein
VNTIGRRINDLERAAGASSGGCPACVGRQMVKVRQHEEPEPEIDYCPQCGRDVTLLVHIVYVERELWEAV